MATADAKVTIVGKDRASGAINSVTSSLKGIAGVGIGIQLQQSFQKALQAVKQFVSESLREIRQFEEQQIGLRSVAKFTGQSIDDVSAAVKAYTADGLIPMSNATRAFKNLMSEGFSLQETIDLLSSMKDTAAFNRQSFFTMGQAVERTTQGIKNRNSILTDSAGIQKNLSVILKEAGFTIQDLDTKEKKLGARQALLNGFLTEGAFAAGDAEKVLNTYGGAVAQLDTAILSLKIEIGKLIAEGITPTIKGITRLVEITKRAIPVIIQFKDQLIALGITMALVFGPAILASIAAGWKAIMVVMLALGNLVVNMLVPAFAALGITINIAFAGTPALLAGLIAAVSFLVFQLIRLGRMMPDLWEEAKRRMNEAGQEEAQLRRETTLLEKINVKLGTSYTELNNAVEAHNKFVRDNISLIKQQNSLFGTNDTLLAELLKKIKEGGAVGELETRLNTLAEAVKQSFDGMAAFSSQLEERALILLSKDLKKVGEEFQLLGLRIPAPFEALIIKSLEAREAAERNMGIITASLKLEMDASAESLKLADKRIQKLQDEVGQRELLKIKVREQEEERRKAIAESERAQAELNQSRREALNLLINQQQQQKSFDFQTLASTQLLILWNEAGLLPVIANIQTLADVENAVATARAKGLVLTEEQIASMEAWVTILTVVGDKSRELREFLLQLYETMREGGDSQDAAIRKIKAIGLALDIAQGSVRQFGSAFARSVAQEGIAASLKAKNIKRFIGEALVATGQSAIMEGFIDLAKAIIPGPSSAAFAAAGAMKIAAGTAAITVGRVFGGGGGGAAQPAASAAAATPAAATTQASLPSQQVLQVTVINQGTILGGMDEFARSITDELNGVIDDNGVLNTGA